MAAEKGVEIVNPCEYNGQYGKHSNALLAQHDRAELPVKLSNNAGTLEKQRKEEQRSKKPETEIYSTVEELWEDLNSEEQKTAHTQ